MARTHLFVDTNVFLSFYFHTRDNLGQLNKLIENLGPNEIQLHLPQQVLNELERNRETKLKASADQFKKEELPKAIPRHMLDYPQAAVYAEAIEAASRARVQMINQAASEASSKALAADKILVELIEKANVYAEDEIIFQRAIARMQKGNPPGKPGSVGDQYNWEYLLQHVPDEDLHIVSKDGDYVSELNTGRPHPFLAKEWNQRKSANLHVYNELRPFIDKYLNVVEADAEAVAALAAIVAAAAIAAAALPSPAEPISVVVTTVEPSQTPLVSAAHTTSTMTMDSFILEKNNAMEALIESGAFATTHSAIAKLEELRSTLSKSDVETLLTAALNNNQISWIASDSDVFAFFTALLNEHHDVDPVLALAAAELFGLTPDEEDMEPRE